MRRKFSLMQWKSSLSQPAISSLLKEMKVIAATLWVQAHSLAPRWLHRPTLPKKSHNSFCLTRQERFSVNLLYCTTQDAHWLLLLMKSASFSSSIATLSTPLLKIPPYANVSNMNRSWRKLSFFQRWSPTNVASCPKVSNLHLLRKENPLLTKVRMAKIYSSCKKENAMRLRLLRKEQSQKLLWSIKLVITLVSERCWRKSRALLTLFAKPIVN